MATKQRGGKRLASIRPPPPVRYGCKRIPSGEAGDGEHRRRRCCAAAVESRSEHRRCQSAYRHSRSELVSLGFGRRLKDNMRPDRAGLG